MYGGGGLQQILTNGMTQWYRGERQRDEREPTMKTSRQKVVNMRVMARLEVKGHSMANSTFAREYLCLLELCFLRLPE